MNNIIYVQPALPRYRLDFFERLHVIYAERMQVYYSPGSLGVLTENVEMNWAVAAGPLRRILGGMVWQVGVVQVPIRRNDIIVLSGNPRQISTLYSVVSLATNRS